MSKGHSEPTWFLLEQDQIFSQSLLWEIQRAYFLRRGVEAWRCGEVPSYATCNAAIAGVYASIAHGFLRDQSRRKAGTSGREAGKEQPQYFLELGAGSGRFAYHFLTEFIRMSEEKASAQVPFRYVLSDIAPSTVDSWLAHPCFQEFFERGVLDVALFDVGDSCDEIVLQRSSETVSAGDLSRPLVVLANYVFDSVPQDLYYLCEGASQECRVSVACDRDPRTLELSSDPFSHIRYRYSHHASGDSKPAAGDLRRLLEGYERSLSTPTCSFPALRCAVCRA